MTSIVHISTNISTGCKECKEFLDGSENFEDCVNHYLTEHNYNIRHVGTETIRGSQGEAWHTTVAVLSK